MPLSIYLEELYSKYHKSEYLKMDPLLVVHKFKGNKNIEIAGLISASLSYGRFELIIRALEDIFSRIKTSIYDFTLKTTFKEKLKVFDGFKYRFNNGGDIAILFESIKHILKKYNSLGDYFTSFIKKDDSNIKNALIQFTSGLKSELLLKYFKHSKGFNYLLPSPKNGSTCKRLNMYLRWMVRKKDGIDFGIWKNVSPSLLIYPVDTHIGKAAKELELSNRKSVDWKLAEEITASISVFNKEDPLKYDFSICRGGMENFRKTKNGNN